MRWRKPKESSEILRPQTDASDPKQNKETPRTHRNGFFFFGGFHRGLSPEAIKARKTKNKRTRESDLRKNLLLRLPSSSDITDKRRRQRQRHAQSKTNSPFLNLKKKRTQTRTNKRLSTHTTTTTATNRIIIVFKWLWSSKKHQRRRTQTLTQDDTKQQQKNATKFPSFSSSNGCALQETHERGGGKQQRQQQHC